MKNSPNEKTAASQLMSNLTGNKRPVSTLTRQSARLSRESLLREMHGYYNQCVTLIQTCAELSTVLRRPEIENSPDYAKIRQCAAILSNDLRTFSDRLRNIKVEQNKIDQIQDDGEFHMQSLSIGEIYMQWTTEFTQVTIPNYETLVGLIAPLFVTTENQPHVFKGI